MDYICYERIEICQYIIEEEFEDASEFDLRDIPKPQEIYTILNQYVLQTGQKSLAVAVSTIINV